MKAFALVAAFVAFHALAFCAADAPLTRIVLSDSPITPDLRVSLQVPAGWSVQWYDAARGGSSLARIFRDESMGRDAIVIAATRLAEKHRGKTEAEIFSEDFVQAFAKNTGAFTRRRVKTDSWDGAYFEYPIKTGPAGYKVETHNWMTIASGYLVQFQCYFLSENGISESARRELDLAVAHRYREILLSIEKDSAR
ncbi:MAG TPA: hypothetical protein VM029_11735 [Opitutaceae bacterium]|nr:hypothetical protein [Opitutaceae bacterium]